MEVQSLSIAVPAPCLNDCKFCVAKMHRDQYKNMYESNRRFFYLYSREFTKRMQFARDNGCNTVILTGDGEPLLNWSFLKDFGFINNTLPNPFKWIELQTSGTRLEDWYLRFLREHVGVTTISLSLSDMFDSTVNGQYNQTTAGHCIDIEKTCSEIKRYDFNLRLSLNMTDCYDNQAPETIFHYAKSVLGADQMTLRVLYTSPAGDTPQDQWIVQHRCNPEKIEELRNYIKQHGRALEMLSFGATRYAVSGLSLVIDDDCMNVQAKESIKYLILRPDMKLYTKWDDPASILF